MTEETFSILMIGLFFLITFIIIFFSIKRAIRKIKRIINTILNPVQSITTTVNNMESMVDTVKDIVEAVKENPEIKSIGGSTSLYLPQIIKDFPEFHNPAAESDIRTFLTEYIHIRYGKQKEFKDSAISNKVSIPVSKECPGIVENITYNKLSIYNYTKTKDSATITYRVSVGFSVNGQRTETRYEVEYTYLISDNEVATVSMKCPNCGAAYESTNDGICEYCGSAIIKDTILSWNITNVKDF